jgi:hypothetical protein
MTEGVQGIPDRFSISTLDISAPKLTPEPSATSMGLTEICWTVILRVVWDYWRIGMRMLWGEIGLVVCELMFLLIEFRLEREVEVLIYRV